jgi:hypothetical protein
MRNLFERDSLLLHADPGTLFQVVSLEQKRRDMKTLFNKLSSGSSKPARVVLTLTLAISTSLLIVNCAHADTAKPASGASSTGNDSSVRSPTKTSTQAHTADNVTVTGGAGAGANTTVNIHNSPKPEKKGNNEEKTPRQVAQKESNTDAAKATPTAKPTPAETPTGTDSSTNVNH